MHASRTDGALRALTVGAVLALGVATPFDLHAQDVAIVSKAVTVGTNEAGLSIGLANGTALEIMFDDGVVLVDGESAGSYALGGELEDSWRALVAQAVQLDDGPLADALLAWEPESELGEDALNVAERIDRRLEQVLARTDEPVQAPNAPDVVDGGTLSRLFSRLDVLGDLGALLGDVALDDLRIVIDSDLEVSSDMVMDGSVLVIGGDVELEGRIRGNLFVVDGDIELRDGGVVEGDLRYADGYLDFEGGEVRGAVSEIAGDAVVVTADFREELAEQIRADIEREVRAIAPRSRRIGIFHRLGHTIEGLFETLMTIFVIGLFGVMVNFFAGENLDRVAEVARRSPGRAATVGFAAGFLSFPVWIIGIIGLAISIIGIPALIVWVPGLPIVVAVAAGFGYIAVARNVGTWLTRQNLPGFEWVRVTRPNSLIFGGVAVLLAPYMAASLLDLVPFLDGFEELATFVGVMLGFMATAAGFGAVLMTRGGKRSEYEGEDWYADLQDLGSDLGDLRGFATDFGRRWTRSDRTDATPSNDATAQADDATPSDELDNEDGAEPSEGPADDDADTATDDDTESK